MSIPNDDPLNLLVEILYGGLPPDPAPGALQVHLLHDSHPPQWPGARLQTWRWSLVDAPALGCAVQVLLPAGAGPVPVPAPAPAPVLLWGDACWAYLDDDARREALAGGLALAWFNRTELAFDAPQGQRAGPLFDRFPQARFGALSAWAWSLSRALDLLQQVPGLDARRRGVVGHSRGGKAALLAGACDERFALVAAHNSGAAGAGSSWDSGPGSEGLEDLARAFPHWLAREGQAGRAELATRGLDQDLLLAAVAPRQLLVLQADGDAWADPEGTRKMVARATRAWPPGPAPSEPSPTDPAPCGDASAGEVMPGVRLVRRAGGHPLGLADWRQVFGAMQALGR